MDFPWRTVKEPEGKSRPQPCDAVNPRLNLGDLGDAEKTSNFRWRHVGWFENALHGQKTLLWLAKNTSLGYRDPKIVCLHLASVCMCACVCQSCCVKHGNRKSPSIWFACEKLGILRIPMFDFLKGHSLLIRFIKKAESSPPTSNLHTVHYRVDVSCAIIHVHPWSSVLRIEGIYQSIYIYITYIYIYIIYIYIYHIYIYHIYIYSIVTI